MMYDCTHDRLNMECPCALGPIGIAIHGNVVIGKYVAVPILTHMFCCANLDTCKW